MTGYGIRIATGVILVGAGIGIWAYFSPNDLQESAGKLIESMRKANKTSLQVEIGGKRHEFELKTSTGSNVAEQTFEGYWLRFGGIGIGPQFDMDSISAGKFGNYKLPFGKYSNHQLRLMTRAGEPMALNDTLRQELIWLLNSANDTLKVLQEREQKGIGGDLLNHGSEPDRSWLMATKQMRNQKTRLPQTPFVTQGGFGRKI